MHCKKEGFVISKGISKPFLRATVYYEPINYYYEARPFPPYFILVFHLLLRPGKSWNHCPAKNSRNC